MEDHFRKAVRFSPAILMTLFYLAGCAGSRNAGFSLPPGHAADRPIPKSAALWLEPGAQSIITPVIAAESKKITGMNRRERLFNAMAHVWQYFSYDRWRKNDLFKRTADQLFKDRDLGGCGDYALAEIVLFRSLGIPSRLVVTANVDWMYQFRQHRLAMTEGHSFIEVYLEDRWYLVDSTYRYLFSRYDPDNPDYPHGESFSMRGRDFWDIGMKSLDDLNRILRNKALYGRQDFQDPYYPKQPI